MQGNFARAEFAGRDLRGQGVKFYLQNFTDRIPRRNTTGAKILLTKFIPAAGG
ncbi:hypothetical protein CAMGR0001_1417 [Campylobacter gracilis RM3268]|uniref:Uncharacterized protein n=1 Tax=Campylobacter gracilis RM3268 TaxID=553220 RepID=C8PJL7_9BACT|nr:hypothetical protein CAMGR0001_1417 [Campylobacter gracilis RM3268]